MSQIFILLLAATATIVRDSACDLDPKCEPTTGGDTNQTIAEGCDENGILKDASATPTKDDTYYVRFCTRDYKPADLGHLLPPSIKGPSDCIFNTGVIKCTSSIKEMNCEAKIDTKDPLKHVNYFIALVQEANPPTSVLALTFKPGEFPILKYYAKRVLNTKEHDRELTFTGRVIVRNNGPNKQSGASPSQKKTFTESAEVSLTTSRTVSIGAQVEIPLIAGVNVGLDKSKGESKSNSTSVSTDVDSPSQKVDLNPFTKVTLTVSFYKIQVEEEYGMDFELDVENTPHLKWFRDSVQENLAVVKLFKGREQGVEILKNGRMILKNVPCTGKYYIYQADVSIGNEEPLSNSTAPQSGKQSDVLQVVDLNRS